MRVVFTLLLLAAACLLLGLRLRQSEPSIAMALYGFAALFVLFFFALFFQLI